MRPDHRNNKALLEKRMVRVQETIEFRRTRQMLTDDNGDWHVSFAGLAEKEELIYISEAVLMKY